VVSGARLALASKFQPDVFWREVRRYGATVAFYAGDLCRQLVDADVTPGERTHPLRLLAGSGMRKDVWQRLVERFGVGVLEFYASTRTNLVLANASGEKIGSVGRPLPGSPDILLAEYDVPHSALARDERGRVRAVEPGREGVLLVRVDPLARAPLDENPAGAAGPDGAHIVRSVREEGDAWFVTWDLLSQDPDGDYRFVDNVGECLRWDDDLVPARALEDAAYELPEVRVCAAYALTVGNLRRTALSIVLRAGARLSPGDLRAHMEKRGERFVPGVLRFVDDIPSTEGYRPSKASLRRDGVPADGRTYVLSADGQLFLPVTS
jgi:putative long chain acyl-CoA synthase